MSTLKKDDNFMAQFAKGDSTKIDEVAAIDYFVKHFKENEEPPEFFNHGLIDGSLDLFVKCIGSATNHLPDALTLNCLMCVCVQSLATAIIARNWFEQRMCWRTGRLLISVIISAIRRFGINGDLYEKSLEALTYLTNDTNYDEFEAKFYEMLKDTGIISIAMDAIATRSPGLVSEGLGILVNSVYEARDMKEQLMAMDGCKKMMYDCLDSSWGTIRVRAAMVLVNLMGASTRNGIDWFSKEVEVIALLIGLMTHHDSNLKLEVSRVFLNVFCGINRNFNSDSSSSLELFVENGVRIIVESATKSGADIRLVNIIREVLPTKLLADQEFCSEAQEYLNDIDVPPPNEGIISTLISYAYAMLGIASSTDDVPDPIDGATTVPKNPSPGWMPRPLVTAAGLIAFLTLLTVLMFGWSIWAGVATLVVVATIFTMIITIYNLFVAHVQFHGSCNLSIRLCYALLPCYAGIIGLAIAANMPHCVGFATALTALMILSKKGQIHVMFGAIEIELWQFSYPFSIPPILAFQCIMLVWAIKICDELNANLGITNSCMLSAVFVIFAAFSVAANQQGITLAAADIAYISLVSLAFSLAGYFAFTAYAFGEVKKEREAEAAVQETMARNRAAEAV
ncbi:hypothetical protein PRIPAC_76324 [Pristionchus pacificus]|uniref:Uncharacterized protein n=1 Tax=Pristionchus pacificus TaxID=54126 RepID=A0A2A6C8W8_PRIPA|nr:hypothetical protein PRIPAC_76324 [Pristionchus pacificus]|eukprot:PDM74557.1 hypothetical protein PRIPAC_41913 [Pristionchus pacificus]